MGFSTGKTLKVSIHLHTLLQKRTEKGLQSHFLVEVKPGARLEDLIRQFDLEIDRKHTLLVINGQFAELGTALQDGDEIHIIPAISGGVVA